MGSPLAGDGFLAAFGSRDQVRLDEFYSESAVLYTALEEQWNAQSR